MKKFAKYLTVEGEIEVPCIVLETLTNGKTELFQVDNLNDINLETQKLAKLFLCSRDIQVGDKVQKNPSNWLISDFDSWGRGDGLAEVLEIIDDSTIDVRWEGGRCYETPNEVLKVIGEISPKAVWVTEGMEFDEDEILQKSKTVMIEERIWLYNEEDGSSTELALEEFLELELKEDSKIHSYKIGNRFKWKDANDEAEVTYYYNEYQIKCPTCKQFH